MTYKDDLLGPYFPAKPTIKPAPRTDGAFEASSGDGTDPADDMATGASIFKGLPQPGTTPGTNTDKGESA